MRRRFAALALTWSRTCPALAGICKTMCSSPASCSGTKAKCRIGRPTAMPSKRSLPVERSRQRYRHQPRPGTTAGSYTRSGRAFRCASGGMHSPSRRLWCSPRAGAVSALASNNFQMPPDRWHYLGTDHDFAAIVRAIEVAREIGNQRAFDACARSNHAWPNATAEDIRELARLGSASFGHAVGTCNNRLWNKLGWSTAASRAWPHGAARG